MCVVCAALRPWNPACDHATLEAAGPRVANAATAPTGEAGGASTKPTLTPGEVADKMLLEFWGVSAPRAFAARAGDALAVDLSALAAEGQAAARAALAEWSLATGLRFVEGSDVPPHIVFDDAQSGAYAFYSHRGGQITRAEVNVAEAWLGAYGTGFGTYGFQTYLHEIGHALGLGHTGRYNGSADYATDAEFANDSWQMSVMSYFDQRENTAVAADRAFAVTPMAADLAAMRRLYGAAPAREGDTVYGEGSTAGGALDAVAGAPKALAFTIHDTGGIDRLELGAQGRAQRVDLREGAASDVFGWAGNMVIAEGTVIEHVHLGSGDDVVTGNAASNTLRGNGGRDTIEGREGDDALEGGEGDDRLHGGAFGEALADGADALSGGAGDDELHGGTGGDALDGGAGNDRLAGEAGDDTLTGGEGFDVFVFGGLFGVDTVTDFALGDRIEVDLTDGLRFAGFSRESSGSVLSFDGADEPLAVRLLDHLLHAAEVAADGLLLVVKASAPAPPAPPPPALPARVPVSQPAPPPRPAEPPAPPPKDTAPDAGPRDDAGSRGGLGDDALRGGKGPDRLEGGDGSDVLRGGAGDDRLHGGNGGDTLHGGAGDDVLDGGAGNDRLRGGAGADTFAFSAGRDVIRDFTAGEDVLDLSGGAGTKALDDVWDAARERGGKLVLDLEDGRLILKGVELSGLGADDFVL